MCRTKAHSAAGCLTVFCGVDHGLQNPGADPPNPGCGSKKPNVDQQNTGVDPPTPGVDPGPGPPNPGC